MRLTIILPIAALLAAGCSDQSAVNEAANQAAAAPKAEKPPHCFFKPEETKGWALELVAGEAVVTGRAYRSDSRYKAVLLEPRIVGRVAEVRPSIAVNDTGFAADENWWDLTASIPAADIATVEVRCGSALIASLPLPAAGR